MKIELKDKNTEITCIKKLEEKKEDEEDISNKGQLIFGKEQRY